MVSKVEIFEPLDPIPLHLFRAKFTKDVIFSRIIL